VKESIEFSTRFESILRRHLRLVAADEPLPADANLVRTGLDSLGTINLLIELEDAFAVSLPAHSMTPATFETRASLEGAFRSLLELV
jgi:acyl carrier protein